ncbi:hypothetical protein [Actinomadura rupiterrae]|uniref:hypothetical protein n=1 Tax=Actinomadura rupiterrae TaxID=559627 RepID=UPI0020A323BB|nr:hypothetical protein [Actinomadura rupiterrae]MCP2337375.1 hypothetical protein [Actinomadura rupiterrae]
MRDDDTKIRWRHSGPVRDFSTWPLAAGGNGWVRDGDPNLLREYRDFNLAAYAGNSATTVAVDFTQDSLANLAPGTVLYFYNPPGSFKAATAHVSSVAEFRRVVCSK